MSTQQHIQVTAKYTLSQEEKDVIQQNMLSSRETKKNLEEEKKNVSNSYKTQIAEQELAIDKACNLLRDGFDFRPFQCYLVKNFEATRREYFEVGTDRLVKTEPLNAGDWQGELELKEQAIRANNEQELDFIPQEQIDETIIEEETPTLDDAPLEAEISPVSEETQTIDTITPAVKKEAAKPKKTPTINIEPVADPVQEEEDISLDELFGTNDAEDDGEEDPFNL